MDYSLYSGAIFDMDGTLLDSMPMWYNLGTSYLIRRGIVPEEGDDERFKAMSVMQSAEYCREKYGISTSAEQIADEIFGAIETYYCTSPQLKEGVFDFLHKLKDCGYNICIATATAGRLARTAMEKCGVIDLFDGILSCHDMGCGKDSPLIYDRSLELIGRNKAETLVFEDALYAVQTCKSNNFICVGVYDKTSECDNADIKNIADGYIVSFAQESRLL